MQTFPVLLANGSSYFGTLFWLFLLPVIVWCLIWLLLKTDAPDKNLVLDESDSGESDDTTESNSPEEAVTASPSSAATEPPPLPESALKRPASGPPSRAFTVWTHPAPAPAADSETADQPGSEEGEIIREAPIEGPPSQAYTIWTKPAAESEDSAGDDAKNEKDDSIPGLDTATAEEAAAEFREDLDSGIARQDEALGILYESQPDEADDLKAIKGVAKVLEGKLHDFGIYQFRQIAFWTDTAVAEFAKRLTFKDRIYKDDWIAQAKRFHEEKYGEKL